MVDPVEESRLVELKQWLQEHHKEKVRIYILAWYQSKKSLFRFQVTHICLDSFVLEVFQWKKAVK